MKRLALVLALVATPVAAQTRPPADSVRVGERLLLKVEGEAALSDTFVVEAGPAVTLPGIGKIPLAGVAPSDLPSYFHTCLAKYLRAAPPVQVVRLMRIAILGEVERPGFYAVASDQPIADVMMRAGGPTRDARMPGVRIERGERPIWEGDSLASAMAIGTTIGAAGLAPGDRIVVPRMERTDPESKFRIISILVGLPVAIYGLTRLF